MKNKIIRYSIFPALILLTFLVSFSIFAFKAQGKRYTFIFPSVDSGKYVVETRFLEGNKEKSNIRVYIDDILLGSCLERTKLLFTAGTKVRSCFVRDGVLYLDLSSNLLSMGQNVIDIEQGFSLLEKNILNNFAKIKRIEFFVDSKHAYEN